MICEKKNINKSCNVEYKLVVWRINIIFIVIDKLIFYMIFK